VYDKDMLLSHKFIVYWQIYTNSRFPTTFKPHLRPVFSLFCSMLLINLLRTPRCIDRRTITPLLSLKLVN